MTGQRVSNTAVVKKIVQLGNQLVFIRDTEQKMLELQRNTLKSQEEMLRTQKQMLDTMGYMLEKVGEMVEEMGGKPCVRLDQDPWDINLENETDGRSLT